MYVLPSLRVGVLGVNVFPPPIDDVSRRSTVQAHFQGPRRTDGFLIDILGVFFSRFDSHSPHELVDSKEEKARFGQFQ